MRILVGIGHPGHVHFYRHIIRILENRGHEVLIASRDKDVALSLLESFDMPNIVASRPRPGIWGMGSEYLQRELKLARIIRKYRPHVTTEIGGLFMAPVSRLFRVPSVAFTDSEHVKADRYLMYPHATSICTPSTFLTDIGDNQVRYDGYHELAYLHPNRFTPDSRVLKKLGVDEGEEFAILRFVAWAASHDIGQSGFGLEAKKHAVKILSTRMRVFITSESPLADDLSEFTINIPPEAIHDALYYASLFLGDGATMATEAGILGTPSVYASSLASSMGNFRELKNRYELVYSFESIDAAIDECGKIVENEKSKEAWRAKAGAMLKDKIDVAEWAADYLEAMSR